MAESEKEGDWTNIFSETHLGLPGFVWFIIVLAVVLVVGLCMCILMSRWRYEDLRRKSSMHQALDPPADMEFWVVADRKDGQEWGMVTEPCPQGIKITAIEPDGILDSWNRAHKGLGWKVNDNYDVNVREHDNPRSKIIGKRRAGSIVFGTDHQEFIELKFERGYIAKISRKGTLLERVSNVGIKEGDVIVEIDGLFGAEDIQKEMARRKVERFLVRRIIGVSDADLLPVSIPDTPAAEVEKDMPLPDAVIEVPIAEQVYAVSDTDTTAMPLEFGLASRWRRADVPAHQMDTVRHAVRTAFDEPHPAPDIGVTPATLKQATGNGSINASIPKSDGAVGFEACCAQRRPPSSDQIVLLPDAAEVHPDRRR